MGDDDRNTWLDECAAERLFAGEQVDAGATLPPADRETAERIAALLASAARVGRPALDAELPGEQAALAAFRAARAADAAKSADPAPRDEAAGGRSRRGPAANGLAVNGRGVNGRASDRVRPGREVRVRTWRAAPEPVVRLSSAGAGASSPPRTPRRRSLRTAAAVTAAGCVLGGVALAAGAVLRTPPATPEPSAGPANSQPATADPERTGDSADEGAASAGGSRVDDRPEGRRDAPDTGTAPGGGADDAGAPEGTHDEAGPGGPGPGAEQGAAVDRLCEKLLAARDGEGNAGDHRSWNRLVREAGGEKAVVRYCEKRVGGHGRGGPGHKADHDHEHERDHEEKRDDD